MKKRTQILLNLALTLFFVLAVIVQGPNLNPLYQEGAFSWCFAFSCYVALNFFVCLGSLRLTTNEYGRTMLTMDSQVRGVKKGFILLAVLWALYFSVSIISMPLFHYKAYRDQLGTPNTSEFSDTVQPIALDQVPIVDRDLARELADKKLGENPGLGSQVILGTPVIQKVDNKLVWVVPLEHSGFFKWLKNMDGSAGYIVVAANSVNDVTLVTDYKIKYQANAYILDDLNRHVRLFGGGLFKGLTDYSFELDDDGIPHWVLTEYKNRWLFRLPEAAGVLIVNATTGESNYYDTNTVPDWVDRVQPESFIMQQIDNQGRYVHGVFNFSNQDKFRPSYGNIIIYNDNRCYLFTGLTSVGSDESAIGFILVDMVTKESYRYQMSGATEVAAQRSAEGKVQQYGYFASFPMIINLNGQPTYFMTLKDNAGLIKQYAFVSVANYTSVGTGETIDSALRDFNQVRGSSGGALTSQPSDKITGEVLRIASESIGESVTYKIILKNSPTRIFTVSYDLSNELALTQVGDRISMDYMDSETGICTVTGFDNLEFEQGSVKGVNKDDTRDGGGKDVLPPVPEDSDAKVPAVENPAAGV